MPNWKDTIKARVRTETLGIKREHGYAILLLPAENCLDLKEGIAKGIFSPAKDRLVVVEKNPAIMKIIEKTIRGLGFVDVYYHCGELTTLNWYAACNGIQFNFVYMDICNPLSADITAFIAAIPKGVLGKGCRFIINASKGRNRHWFKMAQKWRITWNGTIQNKTLNVNSGEYIKPHYYQGDNGAFWSWPEWNCLMTFSIVHKALGMNYVSRFIRGRMYHQEYGPTWMYQGEFEIVRTENRRKKTVVHTQLGKALYEYFQVTTGTHHAILNTLWHNPIEVKPIRSTRQTITRPAHLTPAQWAWSFDNPSSIRNR